MSGERYEPEDDEVRANRFDAADQNETWFSLGTGYGVGVPNFYVCLDENGGERSWWLGPEQADELGRRLVDMADECRLRQAGEDVRVARVKRERSDPAGDEM